MKSEIKESIDMFQGKHLKLKKIDWVDEEGNQRKWEAVERTTSSGIVSIVAITEEEKIVFVGQFRPPVGRYVIEFPAGLCDQAGEAVVESARRELSEETGYLARSLQKLFAGTVSAGLSSEFLTVFLARNLRFVGKKDSREERGITVYEIPLDEIDQWLKDKEAEEMFVDVKIRGHISYIKNILKR